MLGLGHDLGRGIGSVRKNGVGMKVTPHSTVMKFFFHAVSLPFRPV
jgi:hypothetical protein